MLLASPSIRDEARAQGAQGSPVATTDVDAPSGSSARGRYLVHQVAMCVECHSPRDRFGRLQQDRLLHGGPIPFTNPFEGPRWAFQAPYIEKMPGYTKEEFVVLLMTGVRRGGDRPAAPMPQYRMDRSDAEAIWEYLRSPDAGQPIRETSR